MTPAVLMRFAGRAGDRNARAMVGSGHLTAALSERLRLTPTVVGHPQSALAVDWAEQLAAATPDLKSFAATFDGALASGAVPVVALSRCAVALATLPVLAARRPDAVVVWFDAHADLNTPESTVSGYLGGLAFSGPLGWWDSGLGAGLPPTRAVLAGTRDIDPAEHRAIALHDIPLIPPGPGLAATLQRAVAGRPVYVHIDCDVLDPGIVPTEYQVPGGMSLVDLHSAAVALAECEIVGIEIGELEAGAEDGDPADQIAALLVALGPVLDVAGGGS
jgi:arginase